MNSQLSAISGEFKKQCQDDILRVTTCRKKVEFEFGKLKSGEKRDDTDFLRLWNAYTNALVALEAANLRWDTALSATRIGMALAIELFQLRFINGLKNAYETLPGELEKLNAVLKRAKGQVAEAKLQTAFNVALSAAALTLGPVGTVGELLLQAAIFTSTSAAADAALGPERFNAIGDLNTAVGNVVGSSAKLSEALQLFGAIGSTLVTFKFDTDELAHAKQIVVEVQKQLSVVSNLLIRVRDALKDLLPKLSALKSSLEKLIEAYKEATSNRDAFSREYQRVRDDGPS
jgi:hypothetical protein